MMDEDAKIAWLMSMGHATAEEALQALKENNGDVNLAKAQLYGKKPTGNVGGTEPKGKTGIVSFNSSQAELYPGTLPSYNNDEKGAKKKDLQITNKLMVRNIHHQHQPWLHCRP